MRIAHFLPYYPVRCGTCKAVGGMANGVARAGHDVEIWTYRRETPSYPDHAAKVRVFEAPARGWLPSPELRRHIRAHARDYDLIGIHGIFNPLLPVTAWLLCRAGARLLVCQHGSYHPALMQKNRVRKSLYMPLERYALNHCAAVQLLAGVDAPFLRRERFTGPVIVVPNGFDRSDFPAEPRVPGPSPVTRLLFLGRIEVYVKGLDLLVRALARLRGGGTANMSLDCVGPDWKGDMGRLQQLGAELGLGTSLRFPGPDYQRPPHEIIGAYDVVVLPSRSEGFGFVVLEAMLNATPVLVSTEVGAGEHVRAANCGWASPATVEGLAAGLTSALKARSQWSELGRRGREHALAHLHWNEIGRRAVANYQRLVEGRLAPNQVYT